MKSSSTTNVRKRLIRDYCAFPFLWALLAPPYQKADREHGAPVVAGAGLTTVLRHQSLDDQRQTDAALGPKTGLADQQGCQRWVGNAPGQLVDPLLLPSSTSSVWSRKVAIAPARRPRMRAGRG